MTHYRISVYCNDECVTTYSHWVVARGDSDCSGAVKHIFEKVPPLPKDIVGVIVVPTYLH